jgi:NAD(P)-dependent dehydrogenase (short-subunit alcohol dehydrogenase family)/acyl carrier protein
MPPAPTTYAPLSPPQAAAPSTLAGAPPKPTPKEGDTGVDGGDSVGAAGSIEEIDFREMLLSVVAEKTGYPEEILTMEMGLESDLGIDSIKRVEILSALQERMPGLPEVDASQIPNLQTLGQVLEFLEQFEADGGGGNGNGGRAVISEALPGSVSGVRTPVPEVEVEVEVEVKRSALKETTAPATGSSLMEGLAPDAVVEIVDDRSGVARALAERLARRGLQANVVADGVSGDGVGAVLYLGGLRELSDEESAIEVNREAFRLARQVARRFTDEGGVLVTVQDTGGDFGLSGRAGPRAFTAGLASLAKTAALEWDKARVKAVDLERGDRTPEALAETLEQELFDGGPEQEVGLRSDGTRTILTAEPASIPEDSEGSAICADDGSVLVVSGGGRGVTAAALVELARRFRPRVVLLGRTPLEEEPEICANAPDDAGLKRVLLEQSKAEGRTIVPAELGSRVQRILANREIRATLSALQSAGSESRYLAVDVTDAAAVGAALDRIRGEWGSITGVIHGAGVLSDKRIADKTSEQFDRVFDTKVEGLRSLLRATTADPLRLICIYSSVAARFGNVGQCDYAMANEVLNRVAAAEARRRGESCVVRSIDWGPWEGGMVTPSLKAHFKAMGVPLIPIEAGTRMLVEELRLGDGPVEVIIGSPPPQGLMRPSSRGAQQEPSDADSLAVVS